MKRILSLYIIREIASLFFLGIAIFTLILFLGRLIKLTEMVVSRGVPLSDVGLMIMYLMPSFLVFTIPMAFLLAVLLAFGRLSADNEITVMKAGGVSLMQIMPPVLLCALFAALLSMSAGIWGVPWGNSSFKAITVSVLKQNISATIREKVFWDDIPGIVLYTERYDENSHKLSGVVIHDSRDSNRPLTIFAESGTIGAGDNPRDARLILNKGSIHLAGKDHEYRIVGFGEYVLSIPANASNAPGGRNEQDMGIQELRRTIADPATARQNRLKMTTELHSRFALPFASVVFAIVAVPLGMQNRRSGKSAGFTISIGVLLVYYILLSLLRTLGDKGAVTPILAIWIPNMLFLAFGWFMLLMASQERTLSLAPLTSLFDRFRKRSK